MQETHLRLTVNISGTIQSPLIFWFASFEYCFFDPGVRSVQQHHQAVRGAARARQALQAVRHEEVPTEREQRAEETVPRQKVGN